MSGAGQRPRDKAAKAARRKAQVKAKRKLEIVAGGLAGRIRLASYGPIAMSLMADELFESGIGHVILARSLPSGLLGCGYFLVDPFCLGIKDAFYAEVGREELRSRLEAQTEFQTFVEAPPAKLRKLLHGAAAYAAGLGLSTPKDFAVVEKIFGDVDTGACAETFAFGKDGKPFYFSGPLDTPARIRQVCRILQERCGTGGWNYTVSLP